MTSAADDILGQLPLDQLAQQLGRQPEEIEEAVRSAVPSMIGGLERNAVEGGQEESIAKALSAHSASPLFASGSVPLDQVDAEDGSKIVRHIFGEDPAAAARQVSARSGGDQDLLRQLLPILAPIVLGYLARRMGGGQGGSGGGILGDILGGLAGGMGSTPGSGGLGGGTGSGGLGGGLNGGLGAILGQILRGGR